MQPGGSEIRPLSPLLRIPKRDHIRRTRVLEKLPVDPRHLAFTNERHAQFVILHAEQFPEQNHRAFAQPPRVHAPDPLAVGDDERFHPHTAR